jgi:hypothetical protein
MFDANHKSLVVSILDPYQQRKIYTRTAVLCFAIESFSFSGEYNFVC